MEATQVSINKQVGKKSSGTYMYDEILLSHKKKKKGILPFAIA